MVVFEESVMSETRQAVLGALAHVYASHGVNYRLLCADGSRPQAPPIAENAGLARLLRSANLYETSCAESMMRIVRQVSLNGNQPVRELRAVALVLAKETPFQVLVAICKALCEMVSHDSKYRDVFRELGIVQALLRGEKFPKNSSHIHLLVKMT